ncbi:Aste57867_9659 [Aphanomyces stellatus]|uniref:Aste57867_9659 protein n=1 Tax=Aphanomyces stellatus TaxID=120398 RepID=A0A485KNJ0_9STRA|nr:hypothetical protein As57867_009621 [Aphanomyces stellatus]VFT86538.1 Aste57867_9659 [Aphanomyces stellatus]
MESSSSLAHPVGEELKKAQSLELMQRQSSMGTLDRTTYSSSMSMRSDLSASAFGYEERHTTPLVKSKSFHFAQTNHDDGTRSMCEMSSCSSMNGVPMLEESSRPTLSYDTNRTQKGVLTTGILYRRRRGNFAWIERWTLGHFVLSHQSLKYYSRNGGKLLGELDLAGCNEKSIEVMPKDSLPNGKHATIWRFALRTPKRRIILSAATEFDMNSWLRHLRAAIVFKTHAPTSRNTRLDIDMPICDFDSEDEVNPVEGVRPHSISLRNFSLYARA